MYWVEKNTVFYNSFSIEKSMKEKVLVKGRYRGGETSYNEQGEVVRLMSFSDWQRIEKHSPQ